MAEDNQQGLDTGSGSSAPDDEREVVWYPQRGPQTRLLTCPAFDVFFGGARGGGKTDGMLGEWANHASEHGEHAIGLMIRRNLVQLTETIERAKQLYMPLGAVFTGTRCKFPNGARLRFAYLENDRDADEYQGHSYTRVYIEEIGNFPSEDPINKMKATLRSGAGVPCGFRSTGNPGGPGHQWVKARYITPAPFGNEVLFEEFENPFTGEKVIRDRVFIPSKLSDNKYLGADYVANLQMSGSEQLVLAWLTGDWDVVTGAFFEKWGEWKQRGGIVRPFTIPDHWMKFVSHDWGSARPCSTGWWAVASEGHEAHGRLIPKGAMVRYREWYAMEKDQKTGKISPNVGLKQSAEEVAREIIRRTSENEKLTYTVADPSIFIHDGGPSIAERMMDAGLKNIRRADNRRIPKKGAMGGWDQMRDRFRGEDGKPMIYIFDTCTDSIRTIPVLQHDEKNVEDLDTNTEDHAADEWRYGCMSRPYTRPMPTKERAIEDQPTFNERLNRQIKKQQLAGEALI